jgi:glycosyltransferase involved in cell wall biosynthesis
MNQLLKRSHLIAPEVGSGNSCSNEQDAHTGLLPQAGSPRPTLRLVRILVVATKLPWPPVDGGRLVLWRTLEALANAGHEIVVVACSQADAAICAGGSPLPVTSSVVLHPVAIDKPNYIAVVLRSLLAGVPLTIARHQHRQVRQRVSDVLREFVPDVIHVEQLQALANCADVRRMNVPVLLRMQNVESDLWGQTADQGWRTSLAAIEAFRLRRYETRAIRDCDLTLALTEADAGRLRHSLAPSESNRVRHAAPAFPSALGPGEALNGEPCIVLSGSAGWQPNTLGMRWFLDRVWPSIRLEFPGARLHIFGGESSVAGNVLWHAAPSDSVSAFPVNAIVVVPLAVASGIRMRILEAWARGLPVVATTIAASGLDVLDGRELLIADDASGFVAAIRRICTEPDLRDQINLAGREYLHRRHNPKRAAQGLVEAYREAADRGLSAS